MGSLPQRVKAYHGCKVTEVSCRHLVTLALIIISTATLTLTQKTDDKPSLNDSLTRPVSSIPGKDILLTCVVRRLGNYSLIWKYGTEKILTAGTSRIVSDPRIAVLHDEGGDVYVLQIKNVTHGDSGMYTCEVNTEPPLRSFHKVTVLADKLVAPRVEDNSTLPRNTSVTEVLWGFSTPSPIEHDYTDCCRNHGVSTDCLGFCSIKNILEGSAGIHPTKCDPHFKNIVKCMADGRNHVPCCERNQVPDVCQDMCVGEYTVQTDDVRTHISCGSYTAPTLACIAEGIDTLPSRPNALNAENVTDKSIKLRWSMDENSVNPIKSFHINITLVQELIHPDESSDSLKQSYETDHATKSIQVNGTLRDYVIDDLKPFSLYNVTITSENSLGRSLPTYVLKVLTLSDTEAKEKLKAGADQLSGPPTVPDIPDTKQCCRDNNVTHASCVNNFCDPLAIQTVSVPDVIICAPWGKQMFSCVSDNKDHSECCKRRNVPDVCMDICSGKPPVLDYRHFRCVEAMPEIANCMLNGYDVLPSEPRDFRFSNVGTNIGILHWDAPLKHADTIDGYKVTFTKINPGQTGHNVKSVRIARASPFVLEGLSPDSSYEVFIEARNFYGLGQPTTRIVFRTAKSNFVKDNGSGLPYDQANCCSRAGVKPECMPMCQYNASLSEVRKATKFCDDDLPSVTKCAAGGRDHLPCCARRGVSPECQMICQGVQYTGDHSIYTKCLAYIGNIMLCLEEGVRDLPPPIENFHAQFVADTKVTFAWDSIDEGFSITQYEVYYKKLEANSSTVSAFEHDAHINVTNPLVVIAGLENNKRYQFFVISRNEAGTSLPSSVITLNVSRSAWDGQNVEGKPSAPHGIEITKIGANHLGFAWTAPAISNPDDQLKYKLTYGLASAIRSNASDEEIQITSIETFSTHIQLKGLKPNTQYVLFLNAVSTKNNKTSEPSETILAWTNPIVPAFAEPPAVHPSDGLIEGDSMTVLCIALGTPTPTVTLYLGGHPIRSEKTRHMVTNIHNITRDMTRIGCYVNNGFGTPMQSSREITIERRPRIRTPEKTSIIEPIGNDVKIECEVDAWPIPSMSIGKVGSGGFSQSGRSSMKTAIFGNGKFRVQLLIRNVQAEDSGNYYCKANNTHGNDTMSAIKLTVISPSEHSSDMMQCCKDQGVKENCLGICTLQLDLDYLLYDEECYPDFQKFMTCGSDGSDHRHCCSQNGVPRECLDWCRGLPSKGSSANCALSHATTIKQCFNEGQYTLPGPPRNVKVTPISRDSAVAQWEPPEKNAEVVELYRILWKAKGSPRAQKADTSRTKITIENLRPGIPYELVIKAGNANGTSQLTTPLRFITADKYIVHVYDNSATVAGALVAVLLLLLIAALGVWYYRGAPKPAFLTSTLSRTGSSSSAAAASGNRSFENPYFNQEVTMSHLQANDVSGATMSDAIDDNTVAVSDEIPMEAVQDQQSEEGSRGGKPKWPFKPNNSFGFQRFT